MNDNDEIVSLETAKLLKNKGFSKPTEFFYLDRDLPFVKKGLKCVKFDKRKINHNRFDSFIYSAPLQEDANKFLNKIFK